jgi:hypothetical protein
MPNTVGTPAFPSALDDMISLLGANDNAQATIQSAITAGATSFALTAGQGANLPSAGAVVFADNGEIVYFGTNSGDVLTDLLSPVAANHQAGVVVYDYVVAQHHNGLREAIQAIEAKFGIGAGTPPGGNKVLTSTASGESSWEDPSGGSAPPDAPLLGTDSNGDFVVVTPPAESSVNVSGGGIKLHNDTETPGALAFYGTDQFGDKGWGVLATPVTDIVNAAIVSIVFGGLNIGEVPVSAGSNFINITTASDSFTSQDGKTVTVVNGLITSIV